MGGRRARSLTEIVGSGLSAQRGQFSKAMRGDDPRAVAVSSAMLLANSKRTAQILYYVTKLAGFVEREVKSGGDLSFEERISRARREWSRIKKEENLPDDPVVTSAVVSAAARAIAKGRK